MGIIVGTDETGYNDLRLSRRGILAIGRRAEAACRVFNESLKIAHQSKNPLTRENRLQVARGILAELKQLGNIYPFLHLGRLHPAEAGIIKVEAETRELIKVQDAPSLPAGKTVDWQWREKQALPWLSWPGVFYAFRAGDSAGEEKSRQRKRAGNTS